MGTHPAEAAVLYFSRGGNTRRLAEAVADAVGVTARPLSDLRDACGDLVFVGASPYRARRMLNAVAPKLAGDELSEVEQARRWAPEVCGLGANSCPKEKLKEKQMTTTMRMQRARKGLLLFFLLLFPIVLNFLSPYLSLSGAAQGVISGSLLFFGLLLASSLFLGRAFCGF